MKLKLPVEGYYIDSKFIILKYLILSNTKDLLHMIFIRHVNIIHNWMHI